MNTLTNALHRLALRMGWYKDITTGMPLNICRTVFGVYFVEGEYTPQSVGKLVTDYYKWGEDEGKGLYSITDVVIRLSDMQESLESGPDNDASEWSETLNACIEARQAMDRLAAIIDDRQPINDC